MRDDYFKSFLFIAIVLWVGVLVFNLGPSPDLSGPKESVSLSEGGLGVQLSPAGVTISFTDNSNDETHFILQRSDFANPVFTPISPPSLISQNTVPAPSQVTTTDNVLSGNVYTYQVASCNANGCSSPVFSNALSVPEGVPTGVTASVSGTTPNAVNLFWIDNADNEYAYQIERSNDGGLTYNVIPYAPSANSVSYTDINLPSGNYQYRITAMNSLVGPSAYSTVTSVSVVNLAPSAPSGLQVSLA